MYTYRANCSGFVVYKNDIPVYRAGVLNPKKRFNKNDLKNNELSAIATIKQLEAMDKINNK